MCKVKKDETIVKLYKDMCVECGIQSWDELSEEAMVEYLLNYYEAAGFNFKNKEDILKQVRKENY